MDIREVCKKWENCNKCRRSSYANNVCVYSGSAHPIVLFIKVMPSEQDDLLGKIVSGSERIFIEESMQEVLSGIFQNYGISLDDVRELCGFVSVVACVGPSSPEKDEVKACSERLDEVLRTIKFDYPYPICLIGKVPKWMFHKSWKDYKKVWQLPNFMEEVKSERIVHSIAYKKMNCICVLNNMVNENKVYFSAALKGIKNGKSLERSV